MYPFLCYFWCYFCLNNERTEVQHKAGVNTRNRSCNSWENHRCEWTLTNGLVHTAVAAVILRQVNSFGTHSVWQWQWQDKTFMFMHYFAAATSRTIKNAVAAAAPCEWTFKACSHLTFASTSTLTLTLCVCWWKCKCREWVHVHYTPMTVLFIVLKSEF